MVRHRSVRVAVSVVLVVVLGSACTPLPLRDLVGTVGAGSALVPCSEAGTLVQITADSHLDPSCVYTRGFEITASNVVFDCRGARIDDVARSRGRGIHIVAPADQVLENVTVRNCEVSGFLNNVRVTREGFKDLVPGSDYDHPFSDIVIENSRLWDSRGSGVFVNGYVTGVTLRLLDIRRSGSVGIYLEAGSRDNVVEHNTIRDNGFGDVDPVNGIPFDFDGTEVRLLQTGREGIAVDGSRSNRIAHNTIVGNSAGGIFLYKNCGEFATTEPAQWWTRHYGAEDNVIEHNLIADEPNGIWVGSRMAENQYFMDCSDPAYGEGPLRRLHLDQAGRNTLRHNVLVRTGNAIRIEDDRTLVEGNVIADDDPAARGILVGTKERTALLGQPVDGTTIRGNTVSIPGPESYAWIHDHTGTTFEGNLAGGAPSTLSPGTQPVVNPFLFVVRLWVP